MAEYRPHEWINVNTLKPVYSIQARVGKRGWMNVSEGNKPLFFDTAEQRDAKLKELKS